MPTMNNMDNIYKGLVKRILQMGDRRKGRNGEIISYFGLEYKIAMNHPFPILTTKKVAWQAAMYELVWYLNGVNHVRELREYTKIWEPWTDEDGFVPSAYGYRWRDYRVDVDDDPDIPGIDQLWRVVDLLRTDPTSRRMVVVAWDPRFDADSALPPCHFAFTVHYNTRFNTVNIHLTQRSCDIAIGLPFNTIAYSALGIILAQHVGAQPGFLYHTITDAHIYAEHEELILQQIERDSLAITSPPRMWIRDKHLNGYELQDVKADFLLTGYNCAAPIKYEVKP